MINKAQRFNYKLNRHMSINEHVFEDEFDRNLYLTTGAGKLIN